MYKMKIYQWLVIGGRQFKGNTQELLVIISFKSEVCVIT